jgi:hypothetical protein
MITGNDKFCDPSPTSSCNYKMEKFPMKAKRRKLDPKKREELFKSMNEGYANLSEEEREQLKEEAKLWENTLMDGLEDE